MILGGAIAATSLVRKAAAHDPLQDVAMVGTALGATLVVYGGLVLLTALAGGGKSAALVRVDHFLPFFRKKQKQTVHRPSWFKRLVAKVLPASWLSDPMTGRAGRLRVFFKRLGPTMLSSPLRRVIQTICLLAFLWLFFYVCWPYTATPQPAGRVSTGWQLVEIDADTGFLRMVQTRADDWAQAPEEARFLVDPQALDAIQGEFGRFVVVQHVASDLTLRPSEPLTEHQLDQLLTTSGTWDLHERSPWPSHYADDLARKESLPADLFLVIDPLVSLSTAIAARSWVWSLTSAAVILIVCIVIPRGFCGYLCPLGTLIDLFDWAVSKRIRRFRVADDGWWVHLKYYVLLGTLVSAVCGVLVSGFVAAIPIITRGMLFLGEPVQSGLLRGWQQVPPPNAGQFVSILLFFVVLGLGLLRPRFWCKYVCPSGAVFSLGNVFRVSERKVESSCIHCNKCVEICPFDAIKADFTTRVTDCTLCQTCGGVCPTQAIKFVNRGNLVELKVENDPPTRETPIGRRGFVSLAAGTAAALVGGVGIASATKAFGARLGDPHTRPLVRPPGSVPEQEFLTMCIRCGECFKACPYNVLQPTGFEQGLEGLWTPKVVADHAGCASSCNACGQVCPTGAIRALPLAEKKAARMGLAIVNAETCLPMAAREPCRLCVDECIAAGYHAIEFKRMHTQTDEDGRPVEESGFLAPVVLADKCVGCGLCHISCYNVNVHQKQLLPASAIVVEAGEGKEDRILHGSYRALRSAEASQRRARLRDQQTHDYFIPGSGSVDHAEAPSPFSADETAPPQTPAANDDPFGIGAP